MSKVEDKLVEQFSTTVYEVRTLVNKINSHVKLHVATFQENKNINSFDDIQEIRSLLEGVVKILPDVSNKD